MRALRTRNNDAVIHLAGRRPSADDDAELGLRGDGQGRYKAAPLKRARPVFQEPRLETTYLSYASPRRTVTQLRAQGFVGALLIVTIVELVVVQGFSFPACIALIAAFGLLLLWGIVLCIFAKHQQVVAVISFIALCCFMLLVATQAILVSFSAPAIMVPLASVVLLPLVFGFAFLSTIILTIAFIVFIACSLYWTTPMSVLMRLTLFAALLALQFFIAWGLSYVCDVLDRRAWHLRWVHAGMTHENIRTTMDAVVQNPVQQCLRKLTAVRNNIDDNDLVPALTLAMSVLDANTRVATDQAARSAAQRLAANSTTDWIRSEVIVRPVSGTDAPRRSVGSARRIMEAEKVAAVDDSMLPGSMNDVMLQEILDWSFDMFAFSNKHNDVLRIVTLTVLGRFGLTAKFQMEEHVAIACFNYLGRCYCLDSKLPNPYHNQMHAADVVQAVAHFFEIPVMSATLTDLEAFALILAAAMHDFRHPGVSSGFLIATSSPIALRYNDQSVLENFHAAEGFQVLAVSKYNILAKFTKEDHKTVRYNTIQCILATDLAKSTTYINQFSSWLMSDRVGATDHHRLLLLQMAIKCADVAHPARPRDLHIRWSELINQEFFAQGDRERELGLPISPLCDRESSNQSKSQRGFIDFVVLPVFKPFSQFCRTETWLDLLHANHQYWEHIKQDEWDSKSTVSHAAQSVAHASVLSQLDLDFHLAPRSSSSSQSERSRV